MVKSNVLQDSKGSNSSVSVEPFSLCRLQIHLNFRQLRIFLPVATAKTPKKYALFHWWTFF